MSLYNTRAIVLRTIKLSENDKLVTLLTEKYGKIKCSAKSARKAKSPFGAALEPLSCIQLIYFGKENQNIYRLNHCDIIQSFQGVREDLNKIYTALYFIELVDYMTPEGQRGERLFTLLLESIEAIRAGFSVYTICRLFEIRILVLSGYSPRIDTCIICKKPPDGNSIGYSFNSNSAICCNCGKDHPPDVWFKTGTFNYIRKLFSIDVFHSERLKIPKILMIEVESLTHRLIQNQLGQEPKTYAFIKKMLKPFNIF